MSGQIKFGFNVFFKTLIPVLILWLAFYLQKKGIINSIDYVTSKENGIWSVLTGPLLHNDIVHLVGNIIPVLVAIPLVARFYPKSYFELMVVGLILPATYMYMLGEPVMGFSGVTYTFIWFIICAGIGSKDNLKFMIGIVVAFFYGSLLRGVVPEIGSGVAYQAHIVGMVAGLILGFLTITYKPK